MQPASDALAESARLAGLNLTLVPGARWIKRDALQSLRKAQTVVDAAHEQARHIVEAAQVQAQKIIEQAHYDAEQTIRQGYETGYAQGCDEWAEKILQADLSHQKKLSHEKNVLAELVLEAVLQLLGELSDEEWYVRCLRKMDTVINKEASLTLHIHPDSEAGLQTALDELQSVMAWVPLIKIELDRSLSPRSCLLISEHGSVNVSQDFQLKSVMTALENYFELEAGSLCSPLRGER